MTVTPPRAPGGTDFTDGDAGDVNLFPSYPAVDDAFYIGAASKFCKAELNISQARAGTATISWEYWDGSSWSSLTVQDDSNGFSAGTSTYIVSFVPPSDWTANTTGNGPNSNTGYFIRARISAFTSQNTQPQLTQGWVYHLGANASDAGLQIDRNLSIGNITMQANTLSGTNADSKFLLVNIDDQNYVAFTWTQANAHDTASAALTIEAGEQLAIVQVAEDGSTEFGDAALWLR